MQNKNSLPNPKKLTLLIAGVSARVSIASILAISLYLFLLLKLSSEQWLVFGKLVGGLFVLLFAAVSLVSLRMQRQVLHYLEREALGRASEAELHSAYWTATRLSLWMSLSGVLWWAGGGALVAAGMSLQDDSINTFSLVVLVAASTSGGIVSMVFSYYLYKRALASLISELGGRIGNPDTRRELQRTVSLERKTVFSLTAVTIVVVVFSMQLALVTAGVPLERYATKLQAHFLEQASLRIAVEGLEAVPKLAEQLRQQGLGAGIVVVDRNTGQVVARSTDPPGSLGLRASELSHVVAGPDSGDSTRYESENVFTWFRAEDSPFAIVAYSPWHEIRGESSTESTVFVCTLLGAVLLAAAVARFVARDVTRSARELVIEVDRMAAGDLRPGQVMQSEDELGDLAVSFFRMRSALYSTVSRVVGAADTVEAAADRIRGISVAVETSGLEQGRGVERTRASMKEMEDQVLGISLTGEELSGLVEETNSSVTVFSASSQELSRTAASLIGSVDDQVSAMEEMAQSVKQVGENTDSLVSAAGETSSCMEEMASSMRHVNATAEQAVGLSAQVVDAAKTSQAAMAQTVEAMESIRSATESAEGVISALGSRAEEIGAIVDVIDDVADETNLLALNAAIIAAQAGEQGRAFSVVADEIKELADRVQVSTKEIGALIRSVQGESVNAVQAIGRGAESVAIGMDRVSDTGESLHAITLTSRESGERIAEIVKAVREQTKAAGHVVTMMEQVNEGGEGIRSATSEQTHVHESVYRSAIAMRDVAEQMHSTIEQLGTGSDRIRESMSGVQGVSVSVRQTLRSQVDTCAEVVSFLEGTSEAASSNAESARQLSEATSELIAQAQSLREEVKNFKL